jgi:peptidyl-prolyl cis-trans isomerase C
MLRALVRHILVDREETCEELKDKILRGADFAKMARQHSKCPSAELGGALGEVAQGELAPEFDKIAFQTKVGEICGPIRTKYGYHLMEVTGRIY